MLGVVLGPVELHERFPGANSLTFLLVAKGLNLKALLEVDGLLHRGGPRGLCQLDFLPVFLIEEVEKLRFVTSTHTEVFVHFGMFLPNSLPLLVGKVGDEAGVHLEHPADGGLLPEGFGGEVLLEVFNNSVVRGASLILFVDLYLFLLQIF